MTSESVKNFENVNADNSPLSWDICWWWWESRISFFTKLVEVLECADKFDRYEFNIALEDANNTLQLLVNGRGFMTERAIFIQENDFKSKEELLNYLGLDENILIIDGLDDWTLLEDFYLKLYPEDRSMYMERSVMDPLLIYEGMTKGSSTLKNQ